MKRVHGITGLLSFSIAVLTIILSLANPLCADNIELLRLYIVATSDTSKVGLDVQPFWNYYDNPVLHLVAEYRLPGLYSSVYISDLDSVHIQGSPVPSDRLFHWKTIFNNSPEIHWYRVKPEAPDSVYENFIKPHHYASVQYIEEEITNCEGQWSYAPDFSNLVYNPDTFPLNVGTIFVKAEMLHGFDFVSTPGKESQRKIGLRKLGGLSDNVIRLSRKGNSRSEVLNYLLTFTGVPYISNPVYFTSEFQDNQTLYYIGGNEISFILSAAYLAGKRGIEPTDGLIPESNDFSLTDYYYRELSYSNGKYLWNQDREVLIKKGVYTTGDLIWGDGKWALYFEDSSRDNLPNRILDGYDRVLMWKEGKLSVRLMKDEYQHKVMAIRWR